jgi:hypothetical protein
MVDTARARFVPHPSRLLDAVLAASKNQGFSLVILEGVNRGATEGFLPQLMRFARGEADPLTLFHPTSVAADDPYRSIGAIQWPKNLLLAVTLVEGAATLPVTPLAWAAGALFRAGVEAPATPPTAVVRVPTDAPSALFDASNPKHDDVAKALFASLNAALPKATANYLRPVIATPVQRLARGLALMQPDPGQVRQALAYSCIVPALAALRSEEERAECLKACKDLVGATDVPIEHALGDALRVLA